MHFHKVNKGILPLLFVVGLFKITGVASVENQPKSKQDTISTEFEYDDSAEPEVPTNGNAAAGKTSAATKPSFDSPINVVYATQEGENVTFSCAPKNTNIDEAHTILWYRDNSAITNGNTTLEAGNFDVDNKYRLTIYNYTSQTPGNFSCHVMPEDVAQYMVVEFRAPENIAENMAERNAATSSRNNYWQMLGLMALTSVVMASATTSNLY